MIKAEWTNADALDLQPTCNQLATDVISRQAAIDAVQQHREDVLGGYEYDEGVAFVYAAAHNHIIDVIKQLPSAQPMMTNAADLINRGDAILAVYKRIKQLGMENDADVLSIRQSIRDLASAQPYTEEEIQAMQDLEQAQLDKAYQIGVEEGLRSAQPQWIPCSERLPEDYEDVLVWFEYFRYGDYNRLYQTHGIGDYSSEYDSWMINHESGWSKLRVFAWMPLPEPYKGGEQDG